MLGALWWLLLSLNPHLDEARRLYAKLEYEKAEPLLRLAVSAPTSTVAERRESFDLLARTLAAQGRHAEAGEAYAQLLAADASAPGPEDASPRIRALFRDAKVRLYPQGYVKLRQAASPPGQIAVELIDPWGAVARVTLEPTGGGAVTPAEMARQAATPGTFTAPQDERAPAHRVKALDGEGRAVAELQLVTAVATNEVAASRTEGQRWLAWGGVGAAALASAAVAVAMAVLSADAHDAAGRARFYDDVRALDGLARQRAIAAYVAGGLSLVLGVTAIVLALRF